VAAACPEANATLAKLSGHGYDNFVPDCPTATELDAIVAESRPSADLVSACNRTLALGHGGACEGVVLGARRYQGNFGLAPD
jgi:hypothetical protein